MNNCKLKAGTIFQLFNNCSNILFISFEESLPVKISTDSPNAGGVIMEAKTEKNLNKHFNSTKDGQLLVATNKGLKRINKKHKIIFPYGCKTLKEFEKKCKQTNHPTSSADLFLLQIFTNDNDKVFFCLRDGVSFKSSTSKNVSMVYAHNDPEGKIYDACLNNLSHTMGQILFVLYDNSEVLFCYFDKCIKTITSLFNKSQVLNGELVFHGKDCKLNLSKDQGKERKLLILTNRENKKKKIGSDEELKATSFTRGVKIDKKFIKVLIDQGIVTTILKQQLDIDLIDEEDFNNRYPQLS